MDIGTTIISLICVAGLIAAFLLILAAFIMYLPKLKRKNRLNKLARANYLNSRGTAHLNLIRQAHKRLAGEVKTLEAKIQYCRQEISRLEKEKNEKLKLALERYIAFNHLTEVPGIGPKLRDSILRGVFKSHLSDLRSASLVYGVGENRQWSINTWIQQYEQRLPNLMQTDFPGKNDISKPYSEKINAIEKQVVLYMASRTVKEKKLAHTVELLHSLDTVTLQDFKVALVNPTVVNPNMEQYLRGLFAEWEPVPPWFKDLVTEDGDNA
jgi:hypothetical protein